MLLRTTVVTLVLVISVLDKLMTVLRHPWILRTMLGSEENVITTNQLIILVIILPMLLRIP